MWFGFIDHFCHFFHIVNLQCSRFSPSIYRLWAPSEHNSSDNFIPIFLKLCTCFLHSLKLCMCFDIILALILLRFSTL